MNIFVRKIISLIALAWMISFLQSANAQKCQNWCASNAQQWETKCKWRKTCGGCAECSSGMITVPYLYSYYKIDFRHIYMTLLSLVPNAYCHLRLLTCVSLSTPPRYYYLYLSKVALARISRVCSFVAWTHNSSATTVLLCLQMRPLSPRYPLEYVKSGAIRILNRGQRNARGRRGATDAPLVVRVSAYFAFDEIMWDISSCSVFTSRNNIVTSSHCVSRVGRRSNWQCQYHLAPRPPDCYQRMQKVV